eukprot:Rmarinus@m.8162
MDKFVNRGADADEGENDSAPMPGLMKRRKSLKDYVKEAAKLQAGLNVTPQARMAEVAERAMKELVDEAKTRRKSLELDESALQSELRKMDELLQHKHDPVPPPASSGRRKSSTGQDLKTFTLEELRAMASK